MAIAAKPWTGAIGDVVISTTAGASFYGFSYNNTTGGTVVTFYDSATTGTGTILHQETLAATTRDTVFVPLPLRCTLGIVANSSAAVGAAGTVYAS
jgi:hypothetical protein